ncbi:flagellar type III secretion system pore protein FliP [Candidatus Epulonipiscium viviparus]|uniref:flagellar type III secretion system pore protein FliP n=1 Tax=Candidatus Epulonipiscium viviparus TaxID=420336 RepID=UPI000495C206|nr:flagellar type III secretion system pore protein FliP [Candidatus Epulopiscium viviparus]
MGKLVLFLCFLLVPTRVFSLDALNSITQSPEFGTSLQLVFFITFLGLIPTLLLVSTSFTRIIITLYFLKTAMGTQQMPPNQVVIGLALFLTFFVMSPVVSTINTEAIVPYSEGQISQMEFLEQAAAPIKEFMVMQTRDEDIKLFMDLSNQPAIVDETNILAQLPYHIVVPAFIISEIRAGFVIGFLMYLPFIIIDMVVASVLMAMGMMMLPPAMISLPFKILIFIIVDGWHLIIGELVETFNL